MACVVCVCVCVCVLRCVEVVACLPLPKSGVAGTRGSISINVVMPCFLTARLLYFQTLPPGIFCDPPLIFSLPHLQVVPSLLSLPLLPPCLSYCPPPSSPSSPSSLPRPVMIQTDVSRLINSDEIQKCVRPVRQVVCVCVDACMCACIQVLICTKARAHKNGRLE